MYHDHNNRNIFIHNTIDIRYSWWLFTVRHGDKLHENSSRFFNFLFQETFTTSISASTGESGHDASVANKFVACVSDDDKGLSSDRWEDAVARQTRQTALCAFDCGPLPLSSEIPSCTVRRCTSRWSRRVKGFTSFLWHPANEQGYVFVLPCPYWCRLRS